MVRDDPGPVVQRLLLGDELRALRDAAGLTVEQTEAHLKEQLPKWYRTKLNKIENGNLKVDEVELSVLLKVFRVDGSTTARVHQLAKEARRKGAPTRVPDWSKQYVSLERSAGEIRVWSGDLVPGLLQTTAYARETLSVSMVISPADVAPMAAAREERGDRLFARGAPRVWALLGEEALMRAVGEPAVMRGQLARLRDFSLLDNLILRIVSLAAGPHPIIGYPFTLIYVEPSKATIGYVESLTNADYVKNPTTYTLAFDRVMRLALSEDDSRALLDRLISDW